MTDQAIVAELEKELRLKRAHVYLYNADTIESLWQALIVREKKLEEIGEMAKHEIENQYDRSLTDRTETFRAILHKTGERT